MNKKAIITFVVDYKSEQIREFIFSCQRVCPEADLFIYASDNFPELKRDSATFSNVKLIRYQESVLPKIVGKLIMRSAWAAKIVALLIQHLYQWTGKAKGLERWLAPLLQFKLRRLIMMRELMEAYSHEQIMLLDSRDGILHSNPFEKLSRNMIVTGKERLAMKEMESSRKCYEAIYSTQELVEVENRSQLSADVILGFRHAFGQYLRESIEEIFQNISKIVQVPEAAAAIHTRLLYKRLHGIDKRLVSQREVIVAHTNALS
ncbi:MAG: hypothetical protein HOP30_12195 [Cyclobacteriaceae bacterium]|nr:hypothetical protein [Cyclobacteriaceae bacterium]